MIQRAKLSREKIRAWVTKYALTTGVFVVDAEVCADVSDTMIAFRRHGSSWDEYAHGKDWHRTREDAMVRVEEMRAKKIKSLEQQLATLKALSPVVPE